VALGKPSNLTPIGVSKRRVPPDKFLRRSDLFSAAKGTAAMAKIARISSGAPWEPVFGYSRAVKAGGWLAVSGTTAIDKKGRVVGRGNMYAQARQAIANIKTVLERSGMTLADVVRTRVFVTDMERFDDVARAHLEAFGANPPASSIFEIQRLVSADMMIEIEADAYRPPEEIVVAAGEDVKISKKKAVKKSR